MERELIDRDTLFSTIVGSHAYGTNTPESDLDIRGIAILKELSYYFGFMKKFEQFEDKVNDIVIYDIRKAFKLISDCNPNMLDLLFTDERFHRKVHPAFKQVLKNRDKFLSRKAQYTYTGYAFAQLKRIRTARGWLLNPPKKKPERSDFGLPEKGQLSKSDQGAFHWILVNLLEDTIDFLNFSEETKEELKRANWIGSIQQKGIPEEAFSQIQKTTGASDAWMDLMKKEQAYNNAKRHYDSYTQWKSSRNKKRAELEEKFGYDTKHASHLVRLMRMGKEILSTGKVQVFRPDREELVAIRNGTWTFQRLEQYSYDMEKEISEISETSELPKKPDRVYLDNLCCEIVEQYLYDTK